MPRKSLALELPAAHSRKRKWTRDPRRFQIPKGGRFFLAPADQAGECEVQPRFPLAPAEAAIPVPVEAVSRISQRGPVTPSYVPHFSAISCSKAALNSRQTVIIALSVARPWSVSW